MREINTSIPKLPKLKSAMADKPSSPKARPKSQRSNRSKSGSPRSKPASAKSSKSRSRSRSPAKSKSRPSTSTSRGRRTPSAKSEKIVDWRTHLRQAELAEKGLVLLDLTSQGMTALPSSLFTRKDVGDLLLSGNNLRSIPPDIRKLTTLTKLDLSKNGVRCTRPNDYTGLPRDMKNLVNLETLILAECNLPYIPPAVWMIASLKYLDISRNKINILVPEVGNLMNLKTINLQQTNISTLPPEIAFCQDLEEMYLWGNVIETLPETLREMPALKVFAVNHRSFCSLVDSYMENLLKKGQIQSEHIPPVLFEMPALEKLDLESCKINSLPETFCSELKELYLNRNFFQKMPRALFSVTSLQVLDVSNNNIDEIPEDIWKMKNLTVVKFDNNCISRLPASIGQIVTLEEISCSNNKIKMLPNAIGKLSKLKILIFENNEINSLPDTICDLTELETLDLTGNKITSLPIKFHQLKNLQGAHQYNKLIKQGLWLHKNPLTAPPAHVWKTDDPTKVFTHLKRMHIIQTKNLQRQKVYMLGESQSGKTSLVQTLIAGKSALTEGITDSTSVLDYTIWRTQNNVDFLVHDFGGADVYKSLHHMFLDPNGLYLIVYDHRKYTEQNHYKAIGYWLDLLLTHAPGAVVRIVGTQCDLCYEDFIEKTLQVVKENITQQLQAHEEKLADKKALYEEMLNSDDKTISTEQLKAQCAQIQQLQKSPLKYNEEIFLVNSGQHIKGIHELVTEIEILAVDKQLFPNAQKYVPESWVQFRNALKKETGHFLTMAAVKKLAKKFDLTGSNLKEVVVYLADIGDILIYPNNPELKNLVFHFPRHLVSILKCVFQHDLERILDYDLNKIFRCKGQLSRETFTESKQNLLQYGYISREMLKCLWFYLELDYDNFNLLLDLLPKFDLCYSIPQPDIPNPIQEQNPLLIVPQYNRDPSPTDKTALWPEDTQFHNQSTMTFTFPLQLPDGLFERFLCRIQDTMISRMDFRDTTIGEIEKGHLLVFCSLNDSTYDFVVNICVRSSDGGYARRTAVQFADVFINLLKECPGALWHTNISS